MQLKTYSPQEMLDKRLGQFMGTWACLIFELIALLLVALTCYDKNVHAFHFDAKAYSYLIVVVTLIIITIARIPTSGRLYRYYMNANAEEEAQISVSYTQNARLLKLIFFAVLVVLILSAMYAGHTSFAEVTKFFKK